MISEKAFAFPFRDRDWTTKFLVGSLLILAGYVIPIIPMIFVFGYVLRGMRHTIRTGEGGLPEWEDWTDLGVKGVLYLLLQFVYLLPGLVLLLASLAGIGLSFVVGDAACADTGWGVAAPVNLVGKLLLIFGGAAFAAGALALLAGMLMAPIAAARLAATGEFGAALEVGRVWAVIRSAPGNFALAWAVCIVLWHLASLVYTVLYYTVCCCLLIPLLCAPVSLYLLIFGATLFAQVYREGEAPAPAQPPLPPERAERPAPAEGGTRPPAAEAKAKVDEAAANAKQARLPLVTTKGAAPVAAVPPSATALGELELSPRVERLLLENGFVTVGQVMRALETDESELVAIKGLGARSLEGLKTQLRAKGFLE